MEVDAENAPKEREPGPCDEGKGCSQPSATQQRCDGLQLCFICRSRRGPGALFLALVVRSSVVCRACVARV